jgi:hypothetical protein
VTEHLNRHWYEKNTGQVVTEVQRQVFHAVHRWMAATLDGRVERRAPYSRPSSCCRGISRKRQPPRSIWPSCSTICG